jgi:SSS family solute:Na+ symporter
MELHWTDVALFVGFIGFVVAFSMYKGRREKTSEDYFLAGRGLVWPIIGLSLIAANISSEQFVGMNGAGARDVGLAVASYDWIAAITLAIVAMFFLPRLLRTGIYTIPEYLEYRFSSAARNIMSVFMMVIYVGVTISSVVYSGGLTIHTIFGMDLAAAVWLVGAIAAVYTTYGGLKSVAWADLFLGLALLVGGATVTVYAFGAIGGIGPFWQQNADKMHMVLPERVMELPGSALLLGIWIPNLYYWGFNQYIAQRALAARSLREGQLGVLTAAGIQVILPIMIVIPGIIAAGHFGDQLGNSDEAFPMLIRELIPPGLRGLIFAAIAGAIVSSLASMLNSASTIFTMDVYKRHLAPRASQLRLIWIGRSMTVLFVVVGCLIGSQLGKLNAGIFQFIQEFQGFITVGVLATFMYGFFVKRAPAAAAVTGLLLNPIVYGAFYALNATGMLPVAFLNRIAITFIILVLVMAVITWLRPLDKPRVMPINEDFDMTTSPIVRRIGTAIILITVGLYIVFW